MPTNTTPSTALEITALPYALAVDATGVGAGTGYDPSCAPTAQLQALWWHWRSSDQTVMSMGMEDVGAGNPNLTIWSGTLPGITEVSFGSFDYCGNTINGAYHVIVLEADTDYYFQVVQDGATPDLTTYTLAAYPDPALEAPVGSILIPNDTDHFTAGIVSQDTGGILRAIAFPAGEFGDTLSDGTICTVNGLDHLSVAIYTGQLALVTTKDYSPDLVQAIRSNREDMFYVVTSLSIAPFTRTVRQLSTSGVEGDTWELPSNADTARCFAISRDETICYYSVRDDPTIRRYSLSADTPLSDLVASVVGFRATGPGDGQTLEDGSVLWGFVTNDIDQAPGFVRRYSDAGVLLNTYNPSAATQFVNRWTLHPDDAHIVIWAYDTFGGFNPSFFQKIRLSDGVIVDDVETVVNGQAQGIDGEPFAVSNTCPILLLSVALEPEPFIPTLTPRTLPVRWLRRTPHVADTGQRIRHIRLQLDMETGQGNADNTMPVVWLRTSDDGGFTWSSIRQMSVSRRGQYGYRVQIWQLGMARDRVYEISSGDRGASGCIVQGWLDAEATSNS